MFKDKYLKYKLKYNNLKNDLLKQEGGGGRQDPTVFFKVFNQIKVIPLTDQQSNNIFNKLKTSIPKCCSTNVTYYDILSILSNNFNDSIYLVGGAVRDYIQSNYDASTINDIDINYTTEPNIIKDRLKQISSLKEYKIDERNYIVVGSKKESEYLEGFYILPTSYEPKTLESKSNSLMMEILSPTKIQIIDLFNGQGIEEAKNKIWSAPTDKYIEWLSSTKKILWRMLKFKLRGYNIPPETSRAVYNYWLTNSDKIDIIDTYQWQNMWWTLNPNDCEKIIDILIKECLEMIKILFTKKLVIPNKT
jgi:hypothetical protein